MLVFDHETPARPRAATRLKERTAGSELTAPTDSSADVFPLARSLGYHLRELSQTLQSAMDGEAQKRGVSLTQWRYLRELWEENGLTSGELTRRVGREGPTTVAAVRGMERAGLVRIEKVDRDRRKTFVHLTARGRRLATMMAPVIQQINDFALSDFSENEIKVFKQMVVRIQRKLDTHGRHRNSWSVWRTDRLAKELGV
jgi:MarR family transcriptional regulator, organic hydroperoxide resistance regulator